MRNGVGKTTTIRIFLTLTRPDAGVAGCSGTTCAPTGTRCAR
jgi:ABC-type multidrug transport system ATPase subunit